MNDFFEYEEFGEMSNKTPLEEFFEALFPHLENYGVTAPFPADKPSLAQSIYDIEHDVFIGEPPAAVRYIKYQESPYRNGGLELTLESDTLVHKTTGAKLAFKIFISDYIAGRTHAAGNLYLILKFRGLQNEVETLRNALAPVLNKGAFTSYEVKTSPPTETKDKFPVDAFDNTRINSMTNNANFDELAGKAFAPTANESDFENLFAAVFSLDAWYFIADAEFEYKMPYCATFKSLGDVIAITAFTDSERARQFIVEGSLKGGAAVENVAPEDLILRISTENILHFFDRLAPFNIAKIFFNPNKNSHGFHHDLKMMRPIYEHVKNKNLLAKTEAAEENAENHLARLLEENADVIADFEQQNQLLSTIFAGSAMAMDGVSNEDKARTISNTAAMFESVRNEYQMPVKLFRVFIESCLNQKKFLMPILAFAYMQQDKTRWQELEQDQEFIAEYANWLTKKLVPGAELLMGELSEKTVAPADEAINDEAVDEQSTAESAAQSGVDFDALSKKAMTTNAREDLNALFGAAFALSKWNFIMRGEMPNVYPYVASNPAAADNQPMIRAFTDTERLMRFARENNLTEADGSCQSLAIPTENIIPYLEGFIEQGAYGVWFNSDSGSSDFYVPIKQLQPIKDHLAKMEQAASEKEFTTLLLTISDGLSLPSGFVKKSTYNCTFFCWLPRAWTEDLQIKPEYLEKLYEQFYGASWRSGNSDGSRYVVLEANSAVMSPERVQGTEWSVVQNSELNRYWFYIGEANGTFKDVTADEFQAQLKSYFQGQKQDEAKRKQDNLSDFGMSQTPDGDFDLNLTVNQVGVVNFETSIAPFYEAIVPLLKDFQGTGDYATLLRFEDSGKSEEVQNIAENAHGAYLQIRRFLYLNPKNGVRIGVNSIHSNHLRHVESNAELLVSFELCKNLDNQTGVFYHAFQGPRADVLQLQAAIDPILQSVGYQTASQ